MANDEYYVQCKFKQGNATTTTWIPEHGAKVGNTMELIDKATKQNINGRWECVEVYDTRISAEMVRRRERDYLKHRKFSDI
jgi:hypothetical protein